jgi:large subunit ribosomal protein L23
MADKPTVKPEQKSEKTKLEATAAVSDGKVSAAKKSTQDDFDPYQILLNPISTEKAIRQIEFDNKLTFAVHARATKREVKRAVEELFSVRVSKINIQNSFQGDKKAYVKLGAEHLASDISADLGLI